MQRWRWAAGPLVLGLLLLAAGGAKADRVPSHKTAIPPSTGARTDVTVPFLSNGTSTLGAYRVAPRIYASPQVNDPGNPQVKPTFNLIFYGSVQAFGDRNNGAVPRPPQSLRPGR
mgnify:CR=1 FL=1